MEISYLGHSAFKLKGKAGTVVCDPFDSSVGFSMSNVSADILTTSHDHFDHNAVSRVRGTTRSPKPFLIEQPGEYEVGGISIFGVPTYHDVHQGAERGRNTVFVIYMDHLRVCHLGDLGHDLTEKQQAEIGSVDVLLLPVGGVFTITPEQAVKITTSLDPSYVIPMHYLTAEHHTETFAGVKTVDAFLNEYGVQKKAVKNLTVDASRLPEETEVVVLERV